MKTTLTKTVLESLRAVVGAERVLTDADSLAVYGVDRTRQWRAAPGAVVLPAGVDEIQLIVRLANAEQLAIVPSGGRTGLSGGAVARCGEIVLALDRMNRILDFNSFDRTLTCEAGVITQQIQEYAEARQLYYPVDLASAGSSQIGGNIATNAGGVKVIRYGMTRDRVLGLKVVTGGGEVLQLNRGLVKNNTGYDFRHLFIGSEGTLGVIAEATLGLVSPPGELAVLMLGLDRFIDIMPLLQSFNAGLVLTACEFFTDNALRRVMRQHSLPAPFAVHTPFYLLLEFVRDRDETEQRAADLYEQCRDKKLIREGVISQSLGQARNLWRLREDISETLSSLLPYKNDIAVRVSQMPDFMAEAQRMLAETCPELEVVWFGHIGDGNLHLNILKPEDLEVADFVERCAGIGRQIALLVAAFEGSISAEHGIGLLKRDYLGCTRSSAEIALMRQVKRVFDPNGVMNPGKIF